MFSPSIHDNNSDGVSGIFIYLKFDGVGTYTYLKLDCQNCWILEQSYNAMPVHSNVATCLPILFKNSTWTICLKNYTIILLYLLQYIFSNWFERPLLTVSLSTTCLFLSPVSNPLNILNRKHSRTFHNAAYFLTLPFNIFLHFKNSYFEMCKRKVTSSSLRTDRTYACCC